MTNQSMQTITDTPMLFNMIAMFDVSDRDRLKQMRSHKEASTTATAEFSEDHDNFLRGDIDKKSSLKRIRRATKIGLYYWHHGKNSACSHFNEEEFPRLQHVEAEYMKMMRQDPSLSGGIDFCESALGMELDCLSSFLAGSVKDKMLERWHLDNPELSRPQFAISRGYYELEHGQMHVTHIPVDGSVSAARLLIEETRVAAPAENTQIASGYIEESQERDLPRITQRDQIVTAQVVVDPAQLVVNRQTSIQKEIQSQENCFQPHFDEQHQPETASQADEQPKQMQVNSNTNASESDQVSTAQTPAHRPRRSRSEKLNQETKACPAQESKSAVKRAKATAVAKQDQAKMKSSKLSVKA